MEKNRFSILLDHLVNVAEVKHNLLAQELRFDVSYISKWINGRVLPSEKNVEETVKKISDCLVDNARPAGLGQLLRDYQVPLAEDLKSAIYQNLIAEYYYVMESQQDREQIDTQRAFYYPWLAMDDFLNKMNHPILRRVKDLDIMAAIDLFSMENEYRLRAVSQGFNAEAVNYDYPNVHFCLLVDAKKMEKNVVRNALFLSDMLRMLAHVDFRFYSGEFASGKFLFVVKNELAVSGILIRPATCVAVSVCEGAQNSQPLYRSIQTFCTQEFMLLQKINMQEIMVNSTDYVRLLLAPGGTWLLGHVMEHLLPEDLFRELAAKVDLSDQGISVENMLRVQKVAQGIMRNPSMRILVSEAAVSRFVVTGQVDFFTKTMTLDFEQRAHVLEYFMEWLRTVRAKIRISHTSTLPDFQYTCPPSVFLSDAVSFIRLEAMNQKENLLLKINRKEMQDMYMRFVDTLWDQNAQSASDFEILERVLTQQLHGLKILAEVAKDDTEESKTDEPSGLAEEAKPSDE